MTSRASSAGLAVDAENPWPGLAAFREEDHPFFHGREAETDGLHRLVMRERLTVLFGLSGLGKTSLLQAGLMPRLRQENVLPVYIRPDYSDSGPPLRRQVKLAIAAAAGDARVEAPAHREGETLWEYFHRQGGDFWNERNRPVTPLLVFDQFEEVFTLGRRDARHAEDARTLLDELADLVEGRPAEEVKARLDRSPDEARAFTYGVHRYRVLLSVREDFLPDLEELRRKMPTIVHNRMRLHRMRGDAAVRVVSGPGRRVIDPAVAEAVVRFVAGGAVRPLPDVEVEPALLSLVCRELNDKRRQRGEPRITAHLLEGNRAEILGDFYERCLADMQPAVRAFVEDRLLTVSGFRDTMALENVLTLPGVTAADVDRLVARRLLRLEHWGGVPRVELTHDILTSVIRDSRETRRERHAQRALINTVVREAIGLLEREQDRPAALAQLAHALRLDPENAVASGLILDVLGRRSWPLVMTTIRLEGRIAARFSPDGARIVTASQNGTAQVWDAATGAALTAALRHATPGPRGAGGPGEPAPIVDAEFSADGRHLVTASRDGTVVVWDSREGRPIGPVLRHAGPISWARFDPEGRRVVTLCKDDRTVAVWDPGTGTEVKPRMELPRTCLPADLSPDGRRVVTASRDGVVQVWSVESGAAMGSPLDHEGGWVVWARFSPTGRRLITATEDDVVRAWDLPGGHLIGAPLRPECEVEAADFTPDERQLATGGEDGLLRVWDLANGRSTGEPMRHDGPIRALRYDSSGRRIVTGSEDGSARIWDPSAASPVGELLHHGTAVRTAVFRPDGLAVLTTSREGMVRVWDVRNGAAIAVALRHEGPVRTAEFSSGPTGSLVVTASDDRTARVWDARQGRPEGKPLRHDRPLLCARFSTSTPCVVTASEDRTARIWWRSDARSASLTHAGIVRSAEFSPDGTRVVTCSDDGTARVWRVETSRPCGEPLRHVDKVASARFSPDGSRVVTASDDGTAVVWDAAAGTPIGAPIRMEAPVRMATFSPDGARLLLAAGDGTARIAAADDGRWIGAAMKHPLALVGAEFSPDGQRIVTASRDGTARLWHGHTGEPLSDPLRHKGPVTTARFSADGRRVVTASRDRTARLWDVETGRPVGEPIVHEREVVSATLSPDGQRLVTACLDGMARVHDTPTAAPPDAATLAALAEAVAGARVDEQGNVVSGGLTPMSELRQRLAAAPASALTQFVLWFLADRFERTVSAYSGLLVSQYLDQRLVEGDDAALRELQRHCPDHPRAAAVLRTRRPSGLKEVAILGRAIRSPLALSIIAVSPRGDVLAWGGMDGSIRLWDLETWSHRGTLSSPMWQAAGHEALVTALAFLPEGDAILSGHNSGALHLWSVQGGVEVPIDLAGHRPRRHTSGWGHATAVSAAAIAPDGRTVASADADSMVKFWSGDVLRERLRSETESRLLLRRQSLSRAQGAGITALAFARAGAWLVSAHTDRHLRLHDVESGSLLAAGSEMEDCEFPTRALAAAGDDLVLAGGQNRTVAVLRLKDLSSAAFLRGHRRPVTAIAVFPDGERAASVARENRVILWDVRTGQALSTLWGGPDEQFVSVAVYDGGRRLACGLADTRIRLWAEP